MLATYIYRRKGRKGFTLEWSEGGRTRQRTFPTKRKAQDEADRIRAEQRTSAGLTADMPLSEYAERWMSRVAPNLRPGTVRVRRWALDKHLLPILGHVRLRDVTRGDVLDLVAAKLGEGLKRGTVQSIRSTLHCLLEEALGDGIIAANPVTLAGKAGRVQSRTDTTGKVKAFDQEQLGTFLATAAEVRPNRLLLFELMAKTGLRLGEALALRWADLDYTKGHIWVRRGLARGVIAETKTGRERTVDLPKGLRSRLKALDAKAKTDALRKGGERPEWIFTARDGGTLNHSLIEGDFKKVLERAGLPDHFSPHSLRHTYASLLLVSGVSMYYVQRQLGHSSINLTVDLYGKWLPAGNPDAAAKLEAVVDGAPVRKMSGNAANTGPRSR